MMGDLWQSQRNAAMRTGHTNQRASEGERDYAFLEAPPRGSATASNGMRAAATRGEQLLQIHDPRPLSAERDQRASPGEGKAAGQPTTRSPAEPC